MKVLALCAGMTCEIATPLNEWRCALLADGKTVVGMDLNFSEAQESISRMTQGRDQTAMIVTSGGQIAGYTDMSLVGERADEKLPEYADILKRVSSSQEHDSFRAELDGRPCMVYSSETDNGWHLILSADTGTLYGESYRLVLILALINVAMLVLVLIYFGNSVKFTDAPGVITFTVEQMDCSEENATLRFTMEDTGIGMDKEFIPKLFEAFSQEDAGTTSSYHGRVVV